MELKQINCFYSIFEQQVKMLQIEMSQQKHQKCTEFFFSGG